MQRGQLPKPSWVRTAKDYTLNVSLVAKHFGRLTETAMRRLHGDFCMRIGCRRCRPTPGQRSLGRAALPGHPPEVAVAALVAGLDAGELGEVHLGIAVHAGHAAGHRHLALAVVRLGRLQVLLEALALHHAAIGDGEQRLAHLARQRREVDAQPGGHALAAGVQVAAHVLEVALDPGAQQRELVLGELLEFRLELHGLVELLLQVLPGQLLGPLAKALEHPFVAFAQAVLLLGLLGIAHGLLLFLGWAGGTGHSRAGPCWGILGYHLDDFLPVVQRLDAYSATRPGRRTSPVDPQGTRRQRCTHSTSPKRSNATPSSSGRRTSASRQWRTPVARSSTACRCAATPAASCTWS